MFAGIVAGLGVVLESNHDSGAARLSIRLPEGTEEAISQGCSIAVDGVCLTVSAFSTDIVEFDLMTETLSKTTLLDLEEGDLVNIERALRLGEEIGGHEVSGHVDAVASIVSIDNPQNNHVITIAPPLDLMAYVIEKGFIALDGCSLTITDVEDERFSVWLIPETLRRSTFGFKQEGDAVNLEIEAKTKAIVDTARRMLRQEQ